MGDDRADHGGEGPGLETAEGTDKVKSRRIGRDAADANLCRPQRSIFVTLFLIRSKDKQNSISTVGLVLIMCLSSQMWFL